MHISITSYRIQIVHPLLNSQSPHNYIAQLFSKKVFSRNPKSDSALIQLNIMDNTGTPGKESLNYVLYCPYTSSIYCCKR